MADEKVYVAFDRLTGRPNVGAVDVDGRTYHKDTPVAVTAEEAERLLSGEGPLKGVKFSKVEKDDSKGASEPPAQAQADSAVTPNPVPPTSGRTR